MKFILAQSCTQAVASAAKLKNSLVSITCSGSRVWLPEAIRTEAKFVARMQGEMALPEMKEVLEAFQE